MAENSLSQVTHAINAAADLVSASLKGQPAILSTQVAAHFQRRHSHILRDIHKIISICPKSFTEPNFGLSDYQDSTGRTVRAYLLTRDAFSLLVMGMTGKTAVMWKLRYIEAFNALERAALEDRSELARESGYMQGLDEGRAASAPRIQAERKDAASRVWRFGYAKKRRLYSAVRWRRLGLGIGSIAKLLDVSGFEVSELLRAAGDLGLLAPEASQKPLPGVK